MTHRETGRAGASGRRLPGQRALGQRLLGLRALGLRALGLAGAVALALGVGGAARAADEVHFMVDTAGDLAALCGSDPSSANYVAAIHMCQGFILGAHHFHEALGIASEDDVYCEEQRSPAPTRDEVMAEFAVWMAENPDLAEAEAIEGLMAYAAAAFPCR
ncbi:MAG: Rap1a/Tai family immunity protein [Pseudomonadota bacterium]